MHRISSAARRIESADDRICGAMASISNIVDRTQTAPVAPRKLVNGASDASMPVGRKGLELNNYCSGAASTTAPTGPLSSRCPCPRLSG